jgi:uncharacterized SAM-binding protein YcdF (DUF218 family)
MIPGAMELLARTLELPLVIADAFERRDCIVVLGCPLAPGEELSDVLQERVDAAAALYHRGAAARIALTGGITRVGGRRAEAEVMAEALELHGVPAANITVEVRARTTRENARFVAELLRHEAPRVWLVTQPFHGRRARRAFLDEGLDAKVWHIAGSIQYRQRRRALRWLAREYAAWLPFALLGRRQRVHGCSTMDR